MVTRTCLNVRLYVHCIADFFFVYFVQNFQPVFRSITVVTVLFGMQINGGTPDVKQASLLNIMCRVFRSAATAEQSLCYEIYNTTLLTLILRRSRTGTVWFYTSTSNKRAARPNLYTKSLTRDLKLMYSRLTLVRISINL